MFGNILNWAENDSSFLNSPFGILIVSTTLVGIVTGLIAISRYRVAQQIAMLVPGFYLSIVGMFGTLLWWPAQLLAKLIGLIIPVDWCINWLITSGTAKNGNPLLRGDMREAAQERWPPNLYPDLYRAVPEDIVRPIYEDGRLLGGTEVGWLADRYMTESAYLSHMGLGLVSGVVLIVVLLLHFLLNVMMDGWTYWSLYSSHAWPQLEHWPGMKPVLADAQTSKMIFWNAFREQFVAHAKVFFEYLPAQLILAFGVFLLTGLTLLTVWFENKTIDYTIPTKDAVVRWMQRIETRRLLRATYLRQVALAIGHLKNAPTFLVGHATGTLRIRGDLSAPTPGQPIMLDKESVFQHLIVFGGTGEGKTTALLKPLMRQILADKSFGAFVSDAKGVIWQDASRVANALGRTDDVVTIGTGTDQYGVNIVAGLTPSQISAALKSVLTQLGGSDAKSGSFWPDMAAGTIRHYLTVGRSYALTTEGRKEHREGINPYSIWWAYQAILMPDKLTAALATIRTAYASIYEKVQNATTVEEAERHAREGKTLMPPEFVDSRNYLEGAWRGMGPETKTGIIASVTQLLDGFASSKVLRERFACGQDHNCITMREALSGKLVLNTLSSIEDGLPARLVSILIKTTLYREARLREAEWRRGSAKVAPQEQPCLVVMDEVQELVTSDPSSGLSDATFWNVARSTGLAGLFATQTVSALRQAIGEDAANNFVQQARSKVFFRTEEKSTVEQACWCAGSYPRNFVFGEGQRESIEYRAIIEGWDPLGPIDDSKPQQLDAATLRREAGLLIKRGRRTLGTVIMRKVYEPDFSFVPDKSIGENSANATYLAQLQASQAAMWRSDDQEQKYLTEGNEVRPALDASDIIHMGRWHAFAHIQRAGAVRQDLITVSHDFS